MPVRKSVSSSELNAWLTAQIQKVDGCKDCKLTWKYRLQEPEKNGGCNWSEISLELGERTDHTTVIKAARAIGRDTFEQFNLKDDPPSPTRATPESKVNMLPRLLGGPTFFLDANLINARQKLDSVNCMEQWRDNGVISLIMPCIAHEEAQAGEGGNVKERKHKANRNIFTTYDDDDAHVDDTYAHVGKILRGSASDDKHVNDVKIVCEVIKWGAILVTRDGGSRSQPDGILGNRDKLREQFGIQPRFSMRPLQLRSKAYQR